MIQNKNLIYVLALIAGIIILWKFYSGQIVKYSFNSIEEINEDPLIIVGGQVAPKLKKIIGHIEYIDEKTCLKCHLNEIQINFESRPVLAKKMPHEYRENCVSCHIIQK